MTQYAAPPRTQPSADTRAGGPSPHEALRHHIVTAVLVSHDGSRWLDTALTALLGQQRPVQRVIAVDTGSRDNSVDLLEAALGPDAVLHRKRSTGYGAAIAFGLSSSAPVGYDEFGYDSRVAPIEWIWLLHDDCAPAPDALGQLLLAAQDHPDAAVLGPKIRGWYDRRQLLEVGATVAANGRRWTGLEHNEHDQGQHDETRPVLSVSSAGMLVRRDVWDRLRGFDRGISLFRDDLDFCWRVNNAGYQVVVAPDAVLHHAEAAARERRRISAGPNRAHLLDRSHALFTVAVNRDTGFWPLLWLRLIAGTFFRALGYLIAKSPGYASDEFFALLAFGARPDRVLRGRSARRKMRDPEAYSVEQFLPPRGALARNAFDTIWSQLRGDQTADEGSGSRRGSAESGPVSEESESLDTDSFTLIKRLIRMPIFAVGGGLALIAVIAGRSLLIGGTLAGGALLPTPGGASALWSSYVAGWHGIGLGSTSAAPPYVAILAIVGTVLFGKASWAVGLLLIGSVPLAGLSASHALRRVTGAAPLRIWGGYAYALLAVTTGAIATGRLGTAVAVAILPLIATTGADALGGPGRSGSTRAAWTCAFLLIIATAFAPVTWVLGTVFGLVALAGTAYRFRSSIVASTIRVAIILATPMIVLAPWSLSLLRHPTAFLAEIGLPGTGLNLPVPSPIGLLLAGPGGPGTYPVWITAGLLVAALAALLRGSRRRVVISAWSLALVGFGSAVVISGLHIVLPGSTRPVTPWPGVSTAMLGFGLIIATVVGAEGVRDRIATAAFGWRQPLTVLVTGAAVLAPAAAGVWWLGRGAEGPLTRVSTGILPAYVAAEGGTAAQPRTLLLTAGTGGVVDYTIVRGSGPVIGDADIRPPAGQTASVDTVVGNLLSGNGGGAVGSLTSMDVQYVLVDPGVPASAIKALNGAPGLIERSSDTGQYALWAVNGTVGRVSVQDVKGDTQPAIYQCTGDIPAGDTEVCAQPADGESTGATALVPPGSAGRVLVIADQAVDGWTATLGGTHLSPVSLPGGMQAWSLPASGGTVTIAFHSLDRTIWVIGETIAALAAAVMALPFGRTVDEEVEGEEAAEELGVEPDPDADEERMPSSVGRADPQTEEDDDEDGDEFGEDGYEQAPAPSFDRTSYESPQYEPQPQPRQYDAEPQYETERQYEAQGAYESGRYPADSTYAAPEQYAADPYSAEQYATGQYPAADPYASGQYETDQYAAAPDPYSAPEQYGTDQYPAEQYATGQYGTTDQYSGDQYSAKDQYSANDQYAAADPYASAEQYAADPYSADQYGTGQYPATDPYTTGLQAQPSYPADPYSVESYDSAPYPPTPGPYASAPYTVPEQRQPETGDQSYGYPPEFPAQYQGQYPAEPQAQAYDPQSYERDQYEYNPDGSGHGEQDGWTR
jgi:GT2 family glycosyltransferase